MDEIKQTPISIEPNMVSPDVLQNILEEYILREGTNYGEVEISLETKVSQLLKQIHKGDIVLVFDTESESVNLLTKHEFKMISSSF